MVNLIQYISEVNTYIIGSTNGKSLEKKIEILSIGRLWQNFFFQSILLATAMLHTDLLFNSKKKNWINQNELKHFEWATMGEYNKKYGCGNENYSEKKGKIIPNQMTQK